jgi:hypothetical protein
MSNSIAQRLEKYTLKHSQEVLLVKLEYAGEEDEVAIFRGFSSSLMHPTASDPDIPIIPDGARIVSIDRIMSPYVPDNPRYIEQGLSLEKMEVLLVDL